MRVLSKFTASSNIRLSLRVEISSTGGSLISTQQLEEMRTALRELGMNDDVLVEMTRD
jgi:hypothetical protein